MEKLLVNKFTELNMLKSHNLLKYVEKNNFNISIWLNTFLKFKKIYNIKVEWLDCVKKENFSILKYNQKVISNSPIIYNRKIKAENINLFLDVCIFKFENVLINTNSSSFFLLNQNKPTIIIERVPQVNLCYSNYAAGFIKLHNSSNALIRLNQKIVELEDALFLGGNGCFNYYHWMIEIIPKLFFINNDLLIKYNIKCILCDESAKNTPSFQTLLRLVLEYRGINLPIIYINKDTNIKINKIFYINNFNNILFNCKKILSQTNYSHLHPKSLYNLRKLLINFADPHIQKNPKIFLARRQSRVRSYNQEEILSFFEKEGFQAIYLEDYSLEEQISIFYQAEFIVGPSGAAWSNLVFCQSGAKGISWLSEELSNFSVFSTLAKIFNCDLKFILSDDIETTGDIHSNYTIKLTHLISLYNSMK